jgi:hypothetical protein
MSLINCKECKKQISDKALTCPNCGVPLYELENRNEKVSETSSGMSKSTAALLGFILGFSLLYIGCGASASDFVKPSSLVSGVIVGTFFAISFALIFGKSKK